VVLLDYIINVLNVKQTTV